MKERKIKGTKVEVKDKNIESALRVFKSLVYNSGKIKESYENQFFQKPSIKRRKEILKAKIYTENKN